MLEKFFKNPVNVGIAVFAILIIVVLFIWDEKKNTNKDFFGLLKSPSTPAV